MDEACGTTVDWQWSRVQTASRLVWNWRGTPGSTAWRSFTIVDAATCWSAGPPSQWRLPATIGDYVCEPHAAVLAAKLTGTLARKYNLHAIDASVDYLTTDHAVHDPLLSCFAVLEVMPFDMRRLHTAVERHDLGQLEVKRRGVSLDPDEIRRKSRAGGRCRPPC